MHRSLVVFLTLLAAHFVVSFGHSRFVTQQDGDCSIPLSFNPWQWNVVALGSIGSLASPYGADFEGAFAALGSVWLARFTANANEQGIDFTWSASVGGAFWMTGGNIANGGVEAASDVFIKSATIHGGVNTGGDLDIESGNVDGTVNVAGSATYGLGSASQVHTGEPFQMSVDLDSVKKYFLGFSASMKALPDTIPTHTYANQKISITAGSGLQIITIPASELLGASILEVTGNADTTLIINVGGKPLVFDDLTVQNKGAFAAGHLLVNFYEAETIALSGQSAVSILAPLADVSYPAGYIVGNLVVNNLIGNGETEPSSGSTGQIGGQVSSSSPFQSPPCPTTPPSSHPPTTSNAPPTAVPPSQQGQGIPSPPEVPVCINLAINAWQWNVFVLGDIGTPGTPYSSDFEGAFAALGNVWFGSFTVNAANKGVNSAFSATVGGSFSIKGGDVENGGIEAGGNVRMESASVHGNVKAGGNFQLVSGNVIGSVQAAGSASYLPNSITGGVTKGVTVVDLQSEANFFLDLSLTLGAQASTTTFTFASGKISVTVVAGVNYITVDAATLNTASVLSITGPAGSTLAINVPDTTAVFDSLDILRSGGFETGHVVVNFFGATKLALSGQSKVSILAPIAVVVFPGGGIDGNLVAGSLFGSGATGVSPANGTASIGGQVGGTLFSGTLPCATKIPIPTPTPCPAGTAGSACQLTCPVFGGNVCGGIGTCSGGRTGSGYCICPANRCGLACEAEVPSNGVCPLPCVTQFACTGGQPCGWSLASAGAFCNDGNPATFNDRCSVNGMCSGTTSDAPAPGTCRPCVPSDPGCYHAGVATQDWCDATCNGQNSVACPTSFCLCGSPGSSSGNALQGGACRPCKSTDPGCTHAGVANQDWCSWNCYAGYFYYGSCAASHCFCPAGDLPGCTPGDGSDSEAASVEGSVDREQFCEDNCPGGAFNDANCTPDQCNCAAGYEGVTVVLNFDLPPALEAILAALCSAHPEWDCSVDAVVSGQSTTAKRKMNMQDDTSASWTVRVKVADPSGGTTDMTSAVTQAITTNGATLHEQGMTGSPSVGVFGPEDGSESSAPATSAAPVKVVHDKHDAGKIAGIVIGSVVLVILIAVIGFVLYRHQRRKAAAARAGAMGTPYGSSFRTKGGLSMPSSSGSITSPTFSPTMTRVNRTRSARAVQSPGAIAPYTTPVSTVPTPTRSGSRFDLV